MTQPPTLRGTENERQLYNGAIMQMAMDRGVDPPTAMTQPGIPNYN